MSSQVWQEFKTAEGRVYFYNTQTKESRWTKPEELMSPLEAALSKIPWKEFETPDGRKYWNNSTTGDSVWDMPDAYKAAIDEAEAVESAAAEAKAKAAEEEAELARKKEEKLFQNGWDDATEGFVKMLRSHGVDHTWTWEKVLKEAITDENWSLLNDAISRKATFDELVERTKQETLETAKETYEKRKNEFLKVLQSQSQIKSFSRWRSIKPLVQESPAYLNFEDDAESVFRGYIAELKKAEDEQQAKLRQESLAVMKEYFESETEGSIDVFSKWYDVKERMKHNEFLKSHSAVVKTLNMLDILTIFEDCMKEVEDSFFKERRDVKRAARWTERKNREQFISLLDELVENGKITADSTWTKVYPLFKDDSRFTDIVGQPGSSPLELFWDVVERLNKALRIQRDILLDLLEERKFKFTHKTTYEQFEAALSGDPRVSEIGEDVYKWTFERQHARTLRKLDEDRHQEERRLRRKVDALRSVIRHLEPPINVTSTWDDIKPRIQNFPEYEALDDANRLLAFEKQLARTKEHEHDLEDGERHSRERKHSRD
ncbi:hypothetical protein V1512DRAFT_276998 [Lipomyces arxii]|uniref:uncharacterized protein n=1 Tax=Lipomyces arxii TaxID=56418 RepID=UPI0034CD96E3